MNFQKNDEVIKDNGESRIGLERRQFSYTAHIPERRSWFVDIPYSTNADVIEKLGKLGFPVHQRTMRFDDPLSDYGSEQALRVSSLMEDLAKRKDPRPLLVIDDGADFARYLNWLNTHFPEQLDSYVGTSVVDIDASVRAKVSHLSRNCEGLPQLRDDREYDIVFGCTGYNSFHLDQRKLLADNAVLASGSSAAIEFNRAGFIELADRCEDDKIEIINRTKTVSEGIHAPIFLRQEKGKIFSFLHAGFPVNFDGKIECLPTKIIQATHGLLFSASIQALAQEGPGINTVNPDEDKWIFKRAVIELSNSPELS